MRRTGLVKVRGAKAPSYSFSYMLQICINASKYSKIWSKHFQPKTHYYQDYYNNWLSVGQIFSIKCYTHVSFCIRKESFIYTILWCMSELIPPNWALTKFSVPFKRVTVNIAQYYHNRVFQISTTTNTTQKISLCWGNEDTSQIWTTKFMSVDICRETP